MWLRLLFRYDLWLAIGKLEPRLILYFVKIVFMTSPERIIVVDSGIIGSSHGQYRQVVDVCKGRTNFFGGPMVCVGAGLRTLPT